MSKLEFIGATTQERDAANSSTSIRNSDSPFKDKVRFTITGYDYVKAKKDGKLDKEPRMIPIFKTSVGNLFLSMCTKSKVTSDGQILTPDGTFNQLVVRTIHEKTTNREILDAIVNAVAGKQIEVNATTYSALSSYGTQIPKSFIELDIINQ